ncbi:sickle tail protein-like [Arapaima gigas]
MLICAGEGAREKGTYESFSERKKIGRRDPLERSAQENRGAMSTEPSPKKGFKPSRLLKLSSGRAMSKQTSTIRQKTPSLREQPPREAQLHRKRIVPPTAPLHHLWPED